MVFSEEVPQMAFCKPKILPLKSVTLEKLEKMQQEAQEALAQQDAMEAEKAAAAQEGTTFQDPTEI